MVWMDPIDRSGGSGNLYGVTTSGQNELYFNLKLLEIEIWPFGNLRIRDTVQSLSQLTSPQSLPCASQLTTVG